MKAKISIIIPVYNDSDYIDQCLESIKNQTIDDIEVVCVDDLSTDNSREILKNWEPKLNIKNIFLKQNSSAAECRRQGILNSTGEYIMFMDSDDFISPDACEIAYNSICEKKVDILQFGTIIENCANLPESRIKMNERLIAPVNDLKLDNCNLLEECFLNKNISVNVWNKIYNGKICRTAFRDIKADYLPKANDVYATYIILDNANSFSTIQNKLYHYCFGRGQTGQNVMTITNFELCCKSSLVHQALSKYSERKNNPAKYSKVLENLRSRFITEQCNKWYTNLTYSEKSQGFDLLCNCWDSKYIISYFAEKFWFNRPDLCNYIKGAKSLEFNKREIKNIALYYRCISNGGAQRVVVDICNMLAEVSESGQRKYNIFLLTDEEPTKDDYELNPLVHRIIIPERTVHIRDKYKIRAQAFVDIIDNYDIDVFVNSMWVEPSTIFDMMVVKTHKKHPAYVTHCHSFLGMLYQSENNMAIERWNAFSLMDGLVVLSELDELYWKQINRNVKFIKNPCCFKASDIVPKSECGKEILWLGRISPEKQPLEMIKIMELVVKDVPDAVCHIVGDGDEKLLNSLKKEVSEKHLEKNIIFEGFTLDVQKFYSQADIFVSTSSYEGYPLTWFEAAAFGIPSISYDLPYLAYHSLVEGSETVQQLDSYSAAKCIVEYLSNPELLKAKKKQTYSSALQLEEAPILNDWINFFGLLNQNCDNLNDEKLKIIFDQICIYHGKAIDKYKLKLEDKNKELKKVKDELASIKNKSANARNQVNDDVTNYIANLQNEIVNERRKNQDLTNKIEKIKQSKTFRIGKIILWLPKKLLGR